MEPPKWRCSYEDEDEVVEFWRNEPLPSAASKWHSSGLESSGSADRRSTSAMAAGSREAALLSSPVPKAMGFFWVQGMYSGMCSLAW